MLLDFFFFFFKSLVHAGKKLENKLQYFTRYLHNKNVLQYVQILITDGWFMILVLRVTLILLLYIESNINKYITKCLCDDEVPTSLINFCCT